MLREKWWILAGSCGDCLNERLRKELGKSGQRALGMQFPGFILGCRGQGGKNKGEIIVACHKFGVL